MKIDRKFPNNQIFYKTISNPIITQDLKANQLHCRDYDLVYSISKVIAE